MSERFIQQFTKFHIYCRINFSMMWNITHIAMMWLVSLFVKISKYFFSVIENKYCYIPWYYFITLPINVSCTILLISFVSYIVQEIIEKFMPNYRGMFPSTLYYCTIQQKAVNISLAFWLKCIRYTVSYSTIKRWYISYQTQWLFYLVEYNMLLHSLASSFVDDNCKLTSAINFTISIILRDVMWQAILM